MGPYGQVLAGPDMFDFRLSVQFRTLRVQNKVFDEFIDDSAWLLLEKLKNMFFQPKTLIFD